MKIKMYQVDAFTEKVFGGNPAAVCLLGTKWLPDNIMQDIAGENNLAETAFYIHTANGYSIRWFTPAVEVDLCGHATLAAAHVLFHHENITAERIDFNSRSGVLSVSKDGDSLKLNFPTDKIEKIEYGEKLFPGFDIKPTEVYKGKFDYMLIYENEEQIRNINIDLDKIATVDARGVIITAKGNDVDFVSRFFAPQSGINEDPVTGSAHTTLVPYWHKKLNKTELSAKQISARGGKLKCRDLNERTEISGQAVTYLIGEITIENI